MRLPSRKAGQHNVGSRGQSLTEFAIILPILLVLVLAALDFGRVYVGWVNLQQMARVGANYAANNASAWNTAGSNPTKDRYQELMENEATKINCELPDDIPPPMFAGTGLGAHVTVNVPCEFTLITPIISSILGGSIQATGSSVFPVKEGVVATVPGGGGPIGIAPVADFTVSPRTGWSELEVTLTDTSLNGPTGWDWDFNIDPTATGTGVGSVSDEGDLNEGPHIIIYACVGAPGDTCTWSVSLTVTNSTPDPSTKQLDDWITVTVPPDTGPIAEFTGTPRTGVEPLEVDFSFVDLRGGSVTYTSWDWDFGDGTTGTGESVSHTYPDAGTYDVTLTVSDATTSSTPHTKDDYIIVNRQICTVPDFANTRSNQAQNRWSSAGFTTTVNFEPGPNNYVIHGQSIVGGTVDPQPDGCDSVITVGPTP